MATQIARPGIRIEEPNGSVQDRLGARLRKLAERFRGWLAERRTYRRTLRELMELDDRELDDIGIARGDIRRIARQLARSHS